MAPEDDEIPDFEMDLVADGPTSLEQAQDTGETPDPQENKTGTQAPAEAQPPQPQAEKIKPPGRLNEKERQAFEALDPQSQKVVGEAFRNMQAQYTRTTQELKGYKQRFDNLEEILAPRRQGFAMQGLDDVRVVSQLFALSDFADKNPQQFIQWFAQQRGLTPEQIAPQPQPHYVDPELAKRDKEITQLRNELGQFQTKFQSREQQETVARARALESHIQTFRNQTGPDGKPLHPFFDELDEDMAFFFESGKAKDISQAYELAVYANPSTRQKILEAKENEAQRKAAEDMRLRADRARRAGSSISGQGNSQIQRAPVNGSVKDDLSEAWDLALHGTL